MSDTDREPTVVPVGGSVAPDPLAPSVEVPCTCVQEHDFDTVFLAPRLTVPMGMAITASLVGVEMTEAATQGAFVASYLAPPPSGGIVGWTKTDADGDPVPVTHQAIAELLSFEMGGLEVAERASALYADAYMNPFLRRTASSSPPMRMEPSISRRNGSGKRHRQPSKRSSPRASAGRP